MEQKMRNIIEELDRFVPDRNKHQIVEMRASHIFASISNLMEMINENFSNEESEELNKRLISAIKLRNPDKFNRKIREYKNQGLLK